MASSEGSQLRNSVKLIRSATNLISNCTTHTNDTLVLFCYQCQVPICMSCLDEKHRKHDIVSMRGKTEETIKQLELEYNDRSKTVAMHSNISDTLRATKKKIDILKDNKDKMIAVIDSLTGQTTKMLESSLEELKNAQIETDFLHTVKTSIDGSKTTPDSCEAYKNLIKIQQEMTKRSKFQNGKAKPLSTITVKELSAQVFQKTIEQIVGKSERKCDACDTDVSSQNRMILCCEAHELCMDCARTKRVSTPSDCCPLCPTSAEPPDDEYDGLVKGLPTVYKSVRPKLELQSSPKEKEKCPIWSVRPKLELQSSPKEKEKCPICFDDIDVSSLDVKVLFKCKHAFCVDCIDQAFKVKPVCPTCGVLYGRLNGTQPVDGEMFTSESNYQHLPGYGGCGTITIMYSFPDGRQGSEHPDPGKPYRGIRRTAYLPNNRDGQKVARLLNEAFKNRKVFTIGRSTTTGKEGKITWNDIHHKTNIYGGPQKFGYPDPEYLTRVQEELAAKGFK